MAETLLRRPNRTDIGFTVKTPVVYDWTRTAYRVGHSNDRFSELNYKLKKRTEMYHKHIKVEVRRAYRLIFSTLFPQDDRYFCLSALLVFLVYFPLHGKSLPKVYCYFLLEFCGFSSMISVGFNSRTVCIMYGWNFRSLCKIRHRMPRCFFNVSYPYFNSLSSLLVPF